MSNILGGKYLKLNTSIHGINDLGYGASFSWLRRWALTDVTYTRTRLYCQSGVLSGRMYQPSMDDSSYRRNFDIDKKNESHYHSWKEHLKMSKIAKFGCELL
jgi:hypothetical protein